MADYVDRGADRAFSRMAVICLDCGTRTRLTMTARSGATSITCSEGHTTRDWRLTCEAVRNVALTAAAARVDVAPADAETWLRARSDTGIIPEYEDII
ncbi:23S rRNA m(2)G2445 methyltransferase [Streptomyces malaysiensis]|uniref:23S rRNA m(2)G2445 methyltransferase n=2 Tax=Streptomyces malaysiensis TaxID=92644 RepID=A0A7X5X7D6_STRMQ|nr:23S rRNA m(2)G2445 methyltransferase [Streptomyces malaysiensis]